MRYKEIMKTSLFSLLMVLIQVALALASSTKDSCC
jgi:hypothetical protein